MMKDIELLSWILRGSQRREILKVMSHPMIPAQIYKEAVKLNPKITRNSVSDVLKTFRENKLAECINPSETKGRIYKLTSLGEKIKKKLL